MQKGNPLPRTYHEPSGVASFNSEGLPNNGIDYYIDANTIDEIYGPNEKDKPYIVSISGKTLEDNLEMLQKIVAAAKKDQKIDAIELNLACPNVIGKPIIAYDFEQMKEIFKALAKIKGLKQLPLGVKLPPYLDFEHFQSAAKIINQNKDLVQYVVSINTIGNALIVDGTASEAPFISSNNGFAGLSGPAVKYTALANVCKLRQLLDDDIDIVGVGGVTTGQDAFEMLLCGAAAVQIGTCHWKEGASCFDRIHDELVGILQRKGYTHGIRQDVVGKLKPWSKEGAAKARAAAAELKKTEVQVNGTSKAGPINDYKNAQFYKALSALLAILLAVACADKWTNAQLLPTE